MVEAKERRDPDERPSKEQANYYCGLHAPYVGPYTRSQLRQHMWSAHTDLWAEGVGPPWNKDDVRSYNSIGL